MGKLFGIIGLATLVFGSGAIAEPRWCSSANLTPTEQKICDTPRLGDLDVEMSTRFFAAFGALTDTDKRIMRADQSAWLKWRNSCRVDAGCLARRYGFRIAELGGAPVGFGAIDGEVLSKEFIDGEIVTTYVDGRVARLSIGGGFPRITYPPDWDQPIPANPQAMVVQPNYPPALPPNFQNWGENLERNLASIVAGLISPEQLVQFNQSVAGKEYPYRINDHLFIIENLAN